MDITTDTTRTRILFSELPMAAILKLSPEQRSYHDEFVFMIKNGDREGFIEAWYAGELLAVWNGNGWMEVPNGYGYVL